MTTEQSSEVTESISVKKNRTRHSKKSKVVAFDAEVVPKEAAKRILENAKADELQRQQERVAKKNKKKQGKQLLKNATEETDDQNAIKEPTSKQSKKNKKKNKNRGTNEDSTALDQKADETNSTAPKKAKKRKQPEAHEEENEDSPATNNDKKSSESIRAMKRKKYEKLLDEKKIKVELELQQKALNYLSKWKHSRSDWKFEKLRQVWIQTNMYDDAKIPNEFWSTLVEYLANSKGRSRDIISKEALEIIENQNDDDDNEDILMKTKRARDIIQSLQE